MSSSVVFETQIAGPTAASRREAPWPRSRQRRDGEGDEESALLVRVATGDQAAFSELLDRIGGRVYRVAHRVTRDPTLAEDVSQEVLLEVWRNAARFDPVLGTAGAWTVTMTHRRAVDRVRAEQASRERVRRMVVHDQQRAFDEAAEQIILDEEHTEVSVALASLTDKQRRAIELAYYQGHTYREVAELLDTPLGTIKTRIRDGLVRLRNALETPLAPAR